MPLGPSIALLTLIAVLLVMLGEAALSSYNARVLRGRGGIEPAGDVYATMRWVYPACFVAMAIEGAATGPAPREILTAGLAIFGLAKALKMWAISTLGVRWTFRILVLQNTPLVARGPYAFVRHPNYAAVIGELIGIALIVWAPFTGTLAVAGFGLLVRRRIAIEDSALGR